MRGKRVERQARTYVPTVRQLLFSGVLLPQFSQLVHPHLPTPSPSPSDQSALSYDMPDSSRPTPVRRRSLVGETVDPAQFDQPVKRPVAIPLKRQLTGAL